MFGLQTPHGLGLLEAFGKRVDKDRIKAVDGIAVIMQQRLRAGGGVSHSGLRGDLGMALCVLSPC